MRGTLLLDPHKTNSNLGVVSRIVHDLGVIYDKLIYLLTSTTFTSLFSTMFQLDTLLLTKYTIIPIF